MAINRANSPGQLGETLWRSTTLTHSQILGLADSTVELVSTPGDGYFIEFVSMVLVAKLVEPYADGSGLSVYYGTWDVASATINKTALQQTYNNLFLGVVPIQQTGPVSDLGNQPLVLDGGNTAFTAGNIANTLTCKVSYRVWPTGL